MLALLTRASVEPGGGTTFGRRSRWLGVLGRRRRALLHCAADDRGLYHAPGGHPRRSAARERRPRPGEPVARQSARVERRARGGPAAGRCRKHRLGGVLPLLRKDLQQRKNGVPLGGHLPRPGPDRFPRQPGAGDRFDNRYLAADGGQASTPCLRNRPASRRLAQPIAGFFRNGMYLRELFTTLVGRTGELLAILSGMAEISVFEYLTQGTRPVRPHAGPRRALDRRARGGRRALPGLPGGLGA